MASTARPSSARRLWKVVLVTTLVLGSVALWPKLDLGPQADHQGAHGGSLDRADGAPDRGMFTLGESGSDAVGRERTVPPIRGVGLQPVDTRLVAVSLASGERIPFKIVAAESFGDFLEQEPLVKPIVSAGASRVIGQTVWFTADGHVPRFLDLRSSLNELPLSSGDHEVLLARTHRLRLRVTDEQGAVIPRYDLWASSVSLDEVTRHALSKGHHVRQGKDRFGVPAHRLEKPYASEWMGQADEFGELVVDPLPSGFALDLLVTADGYLAAATHVVLAGDDGESAVDVLLRAAPRVRVSVVDTDGAPLPGAEIWIVSRHESQEVGSTGDDGVLLFWPRVPMPCYVECRTGGVWREAVLDPGSAEEAVVNLVVPRSHQVAVKIEGFLPRWLRGERWECMAVHSSGSTVARRVRPKETFTISLPTGRSDLVLMDWRGLVVAEGTVNVPAEAAVLQSCFCEAGLRISLDGAQDDLQRLQLFALDQDARPIRIEGVREADGGFYFADVDTFLRDPVLRATRKPDETSYLWAESLVAPSVDRSVAFQRFGWAYLDAPELGDRMLNATVGLQSPHFPARTVTSAELVGGITLEPGPWEVVIRSEAGAEHRSSVRAVQGRLSHVRFPRSRPSSDLSICVKTSGEAKTWAYLNVEAVIASDPGGAPDTRLGVTNSQGNVTLPSVPHGTLRLRVWGAFDAVVSSFSYEHQGDEIVILQMLGPVDPSAEADVSRVQVFQSGAPVAAMNAFALNGAGASAEALPVTTDGALLVALGGTRHRSHFLVEQITCATGSTIVERGVSIARAASLGATVGPCKAFLEGTVGRYSLRVDRAAGVDLAALYSTPPPLILLSDGPLTRYWTGFHRDDMVSLVDLDDGQLLGTWRGSEIDGSTLPPRE
jgi:hypothetical protein